MPSSIRRSGALFAAAAALCMLAGSGAAQATHQNLLPNSGFEASPTDPQADVTKQPLLPTGWAVEGSAGFFDHSENDKVGGKRMVAISIPASTKRKLCADPPVGCHENPLQPVKDAADDVYSVAPAWRNAVPVPVTGGTSYRVSVALRLSFVTEGEGATVRVRWLDANNLPIRLEQPIRRVMPTGDTETAWEFKDATITSPNGARSAVVLLGHTDDLWLGQVRFDNVFFGTTA